MMVSEEILYRLHYPDSLDDYSIDQLRSLVDQYPYLESLRHLYEKKSNIEIGLKDKLNQLAHHSLEFSPTLQAPNFIESGSLNHQPNQQIHATDYSLEVFNIEAREALPIISNLEVKKIPAIPAVYDYTPSTFIQYLSGLPGCKVNPIAENHSEPAQVTKDQKLQDTDQLIARSVEFNQNIASESLATLWASQGKITEAISVFEKLAAENPEKSTTFAAKIEKLKSSNSL